MKRNKQKLINTISFKTDIIFKFVMACYAIACIAPIILVLAVSFTSEAAVAKNGFSFFPREFSLEAYNYVIFSNNSDSILRAYGVTIYVTVIGTIISLLCIAMFAYPISRPDFKWRNIFSFILFITMIFNAGMIPWYLVCTKLFQLKDSIWGLIIPYTFNAFLVLVMRTFFTSNIPFTLIEAAKIDGANEIRIFYRIVLPLAKPGLATIALFSTISYWNDWYLPLMLINDSKFYNLQYLIYKLMTNINVLLELSSRSGASIAAETPAQTARMALVILAVGPIVIAYPFFRKYFVKGITIGAVKG